MKNNMTVRRGMTLKRKEALTGYLFILLPLISLMILMYYPILRSFFISFFDWNVLEDPKFIGTENYKTLIGDEVFRTSLVNTFKWVIIYVPMSVITSFLLALLLDRKIKGSGGLPDCMCSAFVGLDLQHRLRYLELYSGNFRN